MTFPNSVLCTVDAWKSTTFAGLQHWTLVDSMDVIFTGASVLNVRVCSADTLQVSLQMLSLRGQASPANTLSQNRGLSFYTGRLDVHRILWGILAFTMNFVALEKRIKVRILSLLKPYTTKISVRKLEVPTKLGCFLLCQVKTSLSKISSTIHL